ncbi:YitT family protein [Lutibacter sp.]|uniref:YitT family protein n=1 Tax=Lutibacter sp. TaxID=1925666 RepID=UPI0035640F50
MKRFFKLNDNELISQLILKRNIKDVFFISVGVILASIGLKGFLLPNNFLDGGAMGVSLLLQILTGLNLSILIILVNLPFILLGAKQISIPFAVKSSLAIFVLAYLVHVIQLPTITDDKLLIAVFGGFFLGAGIGFSIRGGAVIDGTEVLAISVSRKSSLTVGDFIAVFNVVLFGIAASIVSVETAMYSMLTYFSASKTVDFIINGIEEYIGVMIVSDDAEIIKEMVAIKLERGVTVFRSDGGFGKKGLAMPDRKILFCVITRLEVSRLLLEVEKIDRGAFVIQYPIKDTKGGMIKKRPFH